MLPDPTHSSILLEGLTPEELLALSKQRKLALSMEDMVATQKIFVAMGRAPTDVELEVIAQTWSEHCKHRIFGALIHHVSEEGEEKVDSLFKTYIRDVTERIMASKPDFVLSAFHDNAGFIKLDDNLALCLKVETHNHPSALEPYAGANTGLGGVIRDIIGAGKGAKPIAALDVFCFGPPDTKPEEILADGVIHPLGIMRGVVRGVRDYGNRMGVPTTSGAIQFHADYIYNPLVFCGTMGVIPTGDIQKKMESGLVILAAGGRTGRDGLRGATFSSASLTTDSHDEDQTAVQIGNPIEEKKVTDFLLESRARGLVVFVTDCGAGGFSSAAGEMLSVTGGLLELERAPLKEPGLTSWEIFLSESQERMVLAVREKDLQELQELADLFQTEITNLGVSDDTGILKVRHHGRSVVELDCQKLHEAPRRVMRSRWVQPATVNRASQCEAARLPSLLREILGDFAIGSRHPIIREYDHEVQGNTMLKPLAGAKGDAPQDGSVIRIDGSAQLAAMSLSLLPEWGRYDPRRMGRAVVDECVRQLIVCGANPDRIAILDNFCMGNPDDESELGALVESVKGMAEAASRYKTPFVSGKDSFYNYFMTANGPVSIPVTLLLSGIGIVEDAGHVIGSSQRRTNSVLCLLGRTAPELGGSVMARRLGLTGQEVPDTEPMKHMADYRAYYEMVKGKGVLSAHDVSEGGLLTAAAEMAFSEVGGWRIDLSRIAADEDCDDAAVLFGESPGRILVEMTSEAAARFAAPVIGRAIPELELRVVRGGDTVFHENLTELKAIWQNVLTPFY